MLSNTSGIQFLQEPEFMYSNRWLTCILIDPKIAKLNREEVRLAFEKENIESRPLWKPMHLQPVFSKSMYYGDHVSEHLFENGLCLPSGTNMTREEAQRIEGVLDRLNLIHV